MGEMKTLEPIRFTAAQLRKLCTGKATPTPGHHPSHRCKDIYLISPTGGPVCHYACNPAELKAKKAWHKEAMTEWLANPSQRQALVCRIMEGLWDSKEEALQAATAIHPTRFIENGTLYFVLKHSTGGNMISAL